MIGLLKWVFLQVGCPRSFESNMELLSRSSHFTCVLCYSEICILLQLWLIFLPCDSACAECIWKLSDTEHIARVKSSARLALKGVAARIRVIVIKRVLSYFCLDILELVLYACVSKFFSVLKTTRFQKFGQKITKHFISFERTDNLTQKST